jgi:hypothetical protein
MKKCPGFFSLPKKTLYIVYLKLSIFCVSMRLFYHCFIVTLNVDRFKTSIYPDFLGSAEKHGNKIGVVP